ncbi:hypothetical protein [Desulfosarcina sp.]|jgi:hypothetical protein|uniref:hypothetical protein n=1 Tax=Desulfosarcina sp. TaxID=2027861 RepID=UPI003970E9D3
MRAWHWIAVALLTVATLIGQFMESRYWWEAVPGFFAAFGLVGCWLIIFGAKALGGRLVSKKTDYYEKFAQKEEASPDAHH